VTAHAAAIGYPVAPAGQGPPAKHHLQLASDELSTWRLAGAAEWAELMEPPMARRLNACAQLLAAGNSATAYLHHGWDPVTTDR
jgi:hypothetical protein